MDFSDYPWVWPPPGFIPFDRNNTFAINPGQSNIVVESIKLDVGMQGWMVSAGIELSSYGTAGVPAFYQLKLDDQIIRDYGRVRVPLGAPNTPATLYVGLRQSQTLTLNITNQTAIIVAARWRLYGWYYPTHTPQ